jgi:hypothetical protein
MSDQYQMERLDHQNEFILTIKNKHNPKDKLSLKKRTDLKIQPPYCVLKLIFE